MTSRGRFWLGLSAALIALVLAAAIAVPVPFLARSPGPVFDVLGEIDGKPVLAVSGTRAYDTDGELDMTTVAESGGSAGALTVGAAILGFIDPQTSVVPDDQKDQRQDDQRDFEEAVFDASQSAALGAAASYLDRPVTIKPVVMDVVDGSPSDGRLEPGDVIQSVNGQEVGDAEAVGEVIQGQPVGTEFSFVVDRDGKVAEESVTSEASDEDGRAVVGILVDNHYASDFQVTVNLQDIGGPSAGLMLALGMVDRITPADLVAGRHVAGTGTITGEGEVGPIGGIDKKMIAAKAAGAELFLAPHANCGEVVGATPDGLAVVPVKTLDEAVSAIEGWRGGQPLASCPVAAEAAGTS